MRKGKHAKNKLDNRKGKRIESPEVSRRIRKLKKINQKKKILNITCIILIVVFISCIAVICYERNNNIKTAKENQELKDSMIESSKVPELVNEEIDEHQIRMNKVKELQQENSDIVGWLEIEGTKISYPLLQGKDNSYYMNHNYKKEKSKDGSLFLDASYNWEKPSTNLLVYGHNNRGSEEMFVDLLKYKDENFYKEHPIIRFTTATEDSEYEIISAFLSRVYYKNEKDVFRYYFFIDAKNEKEFNEYVANSKETSLYDIEATAKYGDQLLTLSTCEYSQEDGRFAVVAKKK